VKRVDWRRDPEAIREFTALAKADGFRLSSIVSGRQVLMRYSDFLSERFKSDIYAAGWSEFLAYKAYLADIGVSRATIRSYLSYIGSYYRLLAQSTQLESISTLCGRILTVGLPRRTWSERRRPFDPAILQKILRTARRRGGEDYIFLLTLLYTGGRAQFYGLKVREVDFRRMEISTVVKPGKRITIPMHPTLAEVLHNHMSQRGYRSVYVFRRGRDPTTRKGMQTNRQNAWRICKRIEDRARIREPVYPHRFRKTLATIGRRAGMDPQFVQAILGHETVMATLDHYAQVDLEDVKREFAKLDLLGNGNPTNVSRRSRLLQELAPLAPKDREHEWKAHVEALLTMAHRSADLAKPPKSHRYLRVARNSACRLASEVPR
jgi:integrase/recombinase XerD